MGNCESERSVFTDECALTTGHDGVHGKGLTVGVVGEDGCVANCYGMSAVGYCEKKKKSTRYLNLPVEQSVTPDGQKVPVPLLTLKLYPLAETPAN